MQVNTKSQALATYNGVKDAIMAAAPGNEAISQEGGAYGGPQKLDRVLN